MRFLLWTASAWAAMLLGVLALDVGWTLWTGVTASHAVTAQIDFTPDAPGVLGALERVSREMDRVGDAVSGRYNGLFEFALYGVLAPLFVAVPLGWEARRRRCPKRVAGGLLGLAAVAVGAWLAWKAPDPSAVYYALVRVTLLSSQALGLSYYAGSMVYFVILPPFVALGYGALALRRAWRTETKPAGPDVPEGHEGDAQAPELASAPSLGCQGGAASMPSTSGYAALALVALGLGVGLASRPSGPGEAPAEGALRLATANLGAGNAQPAQAAEALAQARPDLLVLLEWTGRNADVAPLEAAGLRLVLSDARAGTHGSALLARPGIVEAAQVASPPWRGACAMPLLTARLRAGGRRTVGLLAAHAPPPVAACRASRAPYLRALAALVQDGRTSRAVGAVAAGTPVLLAGDLNALRWEGPIRALAGRGLADAFRAGSWRLGPTWSPHPWSPALARIDYVWMPEGASAEGAWALAVPGSDHRAVVADVALP